MPANPTNPAIDEILIILPPFPCFTICCAAYFVQRKLPFRLTSICLFQSVSVSVKIVPITKIPALFTKISNLPNFLTAFSTKFLTCLSFETSATTKRASLPRFFISETTSFPSFAFLWLLTTILHPSFASDRAIPLPIPLSEPVTMATFPSSFFIISPFFVQKNVPVQQHPLLFPFPTIPPQIFKLYSSGIFMVRDIFKLLFVPSFFSQKTGIQKQQLSPQQKPKQPGDSSIKMNLFHS